MQSYKNISIKSFNTFNIEAKAQDLIIFNTELEAIDFFKQNSISKHLVMGGGSNLLFTTDFSGHLLKMESKGIQIIDEIDKNVWVRVEAGEIWDDVVAWTIDQGLGGLENLSHIPGTMGAAPVQNIGAYGVEFKDVFNSLDAIEIKTGEKRKFYLQELGFDYRQSIFKNNLKNKYFISSVVIRLRRSAIINLQYGHLKEESERVSKNNTPNISDIRQAVINIRESKLPDPTQLGNAGSFFKNPIISEADFKELKTQYPELVSYALENGQYKLAAAWLIEKAGLKGFTLNNATTHHQHALIIVNKGEATGTEIQELAEYIQAKIKSLFKVDLEPEVLMIRE